MTTKRTRARRGVLLLVILSLLAMFAMIAVAFVVLTGHERRGAELARRVDQVTDPPDRQLDQAMRIIERGTINPASAIKAMSLEEQIYGHETIGMDGWRQMSNPQPVAGGQLIEFQAPPPVMPWYPDAIHRIGCVLTMMDGPAAGLSTRIVGVSPKDPTKMQIMAFEGGISPAAGNHYIINGLAYSGMGFGYDPTSGTLGVTVTLGGKTCPLACLPFYTDPKTSNKVDNWSPKDNNPNNSNPANWNPVGGANLDYTAPDYQNPLLAYQVPNGSGGVWTPLPSLHRPELISYVGGGAAPTDKDLLRAVMARPYYLGDHPNFTGSNPSFDPIKGPWDVDNGGTGVADSVWVDLGFPVRYTADGRAYKPLFAILCLDLDGRLNVNAHGMLAQASPPADTYPSYYADAPTCSILAKADSAKEVALGAMATGVSLAQATPTAGGTATLPRGLGYGPAEINLMPLFTGNAPLYQNLLVGLTGAGLNGRYGELGSATPQPGVSGVLWPDTYNRWFDYQGADAADNNHSYWYYRTSPATFWSDAYGCPPDPQGYGAVAVDVAGRPLFMSAGGSCVNTPYDLNLSRNAPCAVDSAPADDKFGPAELEVLLRPFDRDAATLPKRLAALTANDTNAGDSALIWKRWAVTTEQSSVPTPSLALSPSSQPFALASGTTWSQAMQKASPQIDRPRHIVDFLKAAGVTDSTRWPSLLPVEMLAGLKLDLNRPLSNWRAGSPNGFQLFSKPNPGGLTGTNANFTLDASGTPPDPDSTPPSWGGLGVTNPTALNQPSPNASWTPKNAIAARQLQARYLYVLAMLLWEQNGSMQVFTEFQAADPNAKALTQRRLAQWAINAVCFSTPDSVMVPFKYDLNPFTSAGWRLQDDKLDSNSTDSSSNFGVVWGCKPPELLLTETLAFHDRRVADTGFDTNSSGLQGAAPGQGARRLDQDATKHNWWGIMDPTLDQPRIPQGSAFIELFCPRSPRLTAAPADLYYLATPPGGGAEKMWCLDLGQLAGAVPGSSGSGQASKDGIVYPVWRIVITESRINKSQDDVGTPGSGRIYQKPDSSSLEPEQIHNASNTQQQTFNLSGASFPASGAFSLLPGSTDPNVTIERIVWLATHSPLKGNTMALDGDRIYYNRFDPVSGSPTSNVTAVPLPGGQYAIVGPRPVTYLGTAGNSSVGPPAAPLPPLGTPSPQKIVLIKSNSPVGVTTTDSTQNPYPTVGNQIQQPLGIVVAGGGPSGGGAGSTQWPSNWSNPGNTAPNGIGLSISEPLFSNNYYPEPALAGPNDPNWPSTCGPKPYEWYGDPQMQNTANLFRDLPLETTIPANQDPAAPGVKDYPIVKDNLVQTGTTQYYKTVFLQRLANPLAAYDPVNNPYRTVDWMPIDLTVFNGEDNGVTQDKWTAAITAASAANQAMTPKGPMLDAGAAGPYDPDDPNSGMAASKTKFWSRQRGTAANTTDPHYSGNVAWNIWAQISDGLMPSIVVKTTDAGMNSIHFPCNLQHTLGYINSSFWSVNPVPAAGTAVFPLPSFPNGQGWITSGTGLSGAFVGDPLPSQAAAPAPAFVFPWLTWNGRPYISELELLYVPASTPGRLLWEFSFVNTPPGPAPYDPAATSQNVAYNHLPNFFQLTKPMGAAGGSAMELHRLLEFVGVPSRFPCAQTQINPNKAILDAHWFHPPFNRVSNYRDPGRINLNTIPSVDVLQGLLNYYPGMGDTNSINGPTGFWTSFVESRHGAAGPGVSDDVTLPNSSYPTRFANPFRSPGGAAASVPALQPAREVEATLLRSDPTAARPLLQTDASLTTAPPLSPCADYNRNAFFRYEGIQRLGNLVTTRSNVFAVWITVGYFEVTPWSSGIDAGHPDGWQLGQELGSDTGQIERHRSFYIFDRSIPVGFIRGRDINQTKAELLRRFIE